MRNSAVQGRTIVLIICLSLSTVFCRAQEGGNKNLLVVLQSIEQAFNVRFSYAVDDIANVTLLYEPQPSLEASLNYLSKNIPFTFNKIDDRYITVVKNTSEFLCGRSLQQIQDYPWKMRLSFPILLPSERYRMKMELFLFRRHY